MPLAGATNSWVVFSVVISTTGSPASPRSPADLSHADRLPSAVNMPTLGITIACANGSLAADQLIYRKHDVGGARHVVRLESGGEWHRRVGCGQRFDWCVQIVETPVRNAGGNIAGHGACGRVLVDHH